MSRDWTRRLMGVAIVFAAFLTCIPAFAQTGGVTGKCTGQNGEALVGYKLQIERTDVQWKGVPIKTNKKGEYTYIGLTPGKYKVTLLNPDGRPWYYVEQYVGIGDPTQVDFEMGKVMQQAKEQREASPEYKKQVEEQKQSASLKQLFDAGRDLYGQKQYAQAAAIFEKALLLAKDKNIPVVLAQLADTWSKASVAETNPDARKQDQAKSLDYYNKVLQLDPTDAGVHNNLGNLYANMGKSVEAAAEFKKAAELDPVHASGYYFNLGAIMVNQGHMNEAADALKKATDLDATNAMAWYWYGTALLGKAQMKPDGTMLPAPGTIEAFQTYLKLAPNGPMAGAAQSSIQALSSKADLQYKATKRKSH